jgi:uncharacterized glyoxalase superfamily protein PhnB
MVPHNLAQALPVFVITHVSRQGDKQAVQMLCWHTAQATASCSSASHDQRSCRMQDVLGLQKLHILKSPDGRLVTHSLLQSDATVFMLADSFCKLSGKQSTLIYKVVADLDSMVAKAKAAGFKSTTCLYTQDEEPVNMFFGDRVRCADCVHSITHLLASCCHQMSRVLFSVSCYLGNWLASASTGTQRGPVSMAMWPNALAAYSQPLLAPGFSVALRPYVVGCRWLRWRTHSAIPGCWHRSTALTPSRRRCRQAGVSGT